MEIFVLLMKKDELVTIEPIAGDAPLNGFCYTDVYLSYEDVPHIEDAKKRSTFYFNGKVVDVYWYSEPTIWGDMRLATLVVVKETVATPAYAGCSHTSA